MRQPNRVGGSDAPPEETARDDRGTAPRLGLVAYLNAGPIGFGLLSGRQRGRYEVLSMAPAALSDALTAGQLDLALVPSVTYPRALSAGRNMAIVPGIAIASSGPAGSVLLYSRVPPSEIQSVSVDASSRTSIALLRLLFRRRYRPGRPEPRLCSSPPDLARMLATSEAALIIGDRALLAGREHPDLVRSHGVLDLGEEWTSMTGLPFVFAFWAGPTRDDSPGIVAALQDSLEEGLTQIPAIARAFAGEDRELEAIARTYLTRSIRYRLGSLELRGLRTFYADLFDEGLHEDPPSRLAFHRTEACVRNPA